MLIKIQQLIDDAKCYETIRTLRWPEGVHCPRCDFHWVTQRGFHTNQPGRQRYRCHSCEQQFDDLTGTPLAGHHQGVKIWRRFYPCSWLLAIQIEPCAITWRKSQIWYRINEELKSIDKDKLTAADGQDVSPIEPAVSFDDLLGAGALLGRYNPQIGKVTSLPRAYPEANASVHPST